MKQESITIFFLKSEGSFTANDAMELQKLLQTASDDAFPILMTHKASINPIIKWFLYVIAAFWGLMCCFAFYKILLEGALEYALYLTLAFNVSLVGFLLAKFLKPSKRRMYREYLMIALAYQIKD